MFWILIFVLLIHGKVYTFSDFNRVKVFKDNIPTVQTLFLDNNALKQRLADPDIASFLKTLPVGFKHLSLLKPIITYEKFKNILIKTCIDLARKNDLLNTPLAKENISKVRPEEGNPLYNIFPPGFFEKAVLFDQHAVVHIIGDQHASFHDTVEFLNSVFYSKNNVKETPFLENSFTLKDQFKKHHWIFCGDLTDTGIYGVETLAIICLVYLANPENIHIIRGNHEDIRINNRYGFLTEIKEKYKNDLKTSNMKYDPFMFLQNILTKFYDQLPVALWGIFKSPDEKNNVVLFCHGGIEFDDKDLIPFFDECATKGVAYKNVNGFFSGDPGNVGYLWNDFEPNNTILESDLIEGRGYRISEKDFNEWIESNFKNQNKFNFAHMFRAHQHSTTYTELMPTLIQNSGICELWNYKNPLVTTLCVMPCTGFGIPYRTKYHTYPGVIQNTKVTIYCNKETTSWMYEFITLPNHHIPKDIIRKHIRYKQKTNSLLNPKNAKVYNLLEGQEVIEYKNGSQSIYVRELHAGKMSFYQKMQGFMQKSADKIKLWFGF